MGLLIIFQVALDLGLIAMMSLLLIERTKAKSQEDPRLSKGLQLLSSKIAILQDLMDRSETIARQLTQIMDRKQQDVQEKVEEVEVHLHKLKLAVEKSQEVAKIFQDKIPHQEIIERQTTLKYLQAAKMAHQGLPIDDIAKQVDLSRGEIELIAKVNKDRLVVETPIWASSASDDRLSTPIVDSTHEEFVHKTLEPAAPTVVETAPTPAAAPEAEADVVRPLIFKNLSNLNDLG